MNLTYGELMSLSDKGHKIYEIWKDPIYVRTQHGKNGGDYYTDPVLQVQSFGDTLKLPPQVVKRFPPIKKLKVGSGINRWSYGAGYSESSDIEMLLIVFKQAGYSVVRIEVKIDSSGKPYKLYYVADIKENGLPSFISGI
jgi:hypothetical protein